MTEPARRDRQASGFVCPACGGALWEYGVRPGLRFECRIGDRFSAAELWIEHCAARNRALKYAARVLAENAALARKLAAWTTEQGNHVASIRLAEEAAEEDHLVDHISQMLEGLPTPAGGAADDLERP
jgi:two-component system, chemotaxis family, protein-glutamate methylesterase/glutaminase